LDAREQHNNVNVISNMQLINVHKQTKQKKHKKTNTATPIEMKTEN
jgi:hypothetical protein